MPITPRLDSLIKRALSNDILSQKEARGILKEAEKEGVSADEVDAIVGALAEALQDGLELEKFSRKKNLNRFLAQLESHRPLGLDENGIERKPDGAVNYVGALMMRSGVDPTPAPVDPAPVDPAPVDPAPVDPAPVDPAPVDPAPTGPPTLQVDLKNATQAQADALLALLPKGQIDTLPDGEKTALADNLLEALGTADAFDGKDPLQFEKTQMFAAGAGALSRLSSALTEAQVDGLFGLFGKAPNPMAQSLILQTLDGATLTDAQKTKLGALERPEHEKALLTEWNKVADGSGRAGYSRLEGPVALLTLAGLAYCKKPASIENLLDGIATFKDLNPGNYSAPFDGEEVGHLTKQLKAYVTEHELLAYTFGTWKNHAPKHLAKLTNARVAPGLTAALDGTPPKWGQIELTDKQAQLMRKLVGGVKDDPAARKIEEALKEAAFAVSPNARGYGGVPTPSGTLGGTASEAFSRVATRFLDNQDGTPDGMIDASGLAKAMKAEADDIRTTLQPRLAELGNTPPSFQGIEVSPEVGATLKQLLVERSRSSMSATNLGLALKLVADKNGGEVKSQQAAAQLDRIVDSYMENWPNLSVFDFNKLERIAKFAVEGKDVPLCKLNGQALKLAEFYGKVAGAVAGSIDPSMTRHAWMADRWGYRAKQSVELLDVIAENTAKGKGPVAELRAKFPGKTVDVQATGLDGAHQQFLYAVMNGDRVEQLYNQGSDGSLQVYKDRKDPVLFSAAVNGDGSFDVRVPDKNRFNKYPLQTTYGIGDSIDVAYFDSEAIEVRTEGEKFDTRYKNLQGIITGFTPDGDYTVKFNKPDGTETEQTMSLDKIKKHNTPHYFSETGSYLRDVDINIKDDQPLKDFLDGADPIIQRHLPTDGSQATMSAQELAKRQKACVAELMKYADERMKYPKGKDSSDANSKRYWELDDLYRYPIGELLKIGKGQCRHQCIAEHLLLQRAGIDSRLASGAANTGSGNYRGLHLWVELTLADNSRYLSDQTWKDEAVPLWGGAYDSDKRRIEIWNRTSDFDLRHVS
jgi:hypothetical protein